ncbi:Beta-barrel assembly machine subunit BamC [Arsukibacterium tuosuense]|uniref:Beta-barrel assembly machine subunit BamC n=1 Tax=Arsukibacterium tuosuense TaxID=1323745 RepID=A0A285IRW8_9GAMM|nr:outer membrane protein assembly factor BamC [Arsukibacterium tuosuense]SNY50765.1 Beta-barrel assembly machine subunit BamC [Arsukibacterium tuosuense]
MHYWKKSCITLSLATVLLSGCSVFKDEPDSRAQRQQVKLDIPAELATPRQPGKYDIPQSDGVVGDVADKSPVLVLATASSSRITDEAEKLARVMFERNDLTGDLIPFLKAQISNYFAAENIDINATDSDKLNFETGWIKGYRTEGFWFWQDEQQVDEARYAINIEPRPHGRTATVKVTLLEHRYFDKQAQLSKATVRDNEVALLNGLINQVAVAEIETAIANRDRVPEVGLEPGLNSAGDPAFITQQSIDVTWSQLEPVFEQLNFTVNDINRSAFTYYVSYSKPSRGMWSTLMGQEPPPVLPIAESDYQIVLQRAAAGTVITLLTKEGKPLAADTVVAAYDPFVAAIKAAKVEL